MLASSSPSAPAWIDAFSPGSTHLSAISDPNHRKELKLGISAFSVPPSSPPFPRVSREARPWRAGDLCRRLQHFTCHRPGPLHPSAPHPASLYVSRRRLSEGSKSQ